METLIENNATATERGAKNLMRAYSAQINDVMPIALWCFVQLPCSEEAIMRTAQKHWTWQPLPCSSGEIVLYSSGMARVEGMPPAVGDRLYVHTRAASNGQYLWSLLSDNECYHRETAIMPGESCTIVDEFSGETMYYYNEGLFVVSQVETYRDEILIVMRSVV